MTEGTTVNKKYKDTVFRKLFGENKANALSLYNAINGTDYTEDSDFEYCIFVLFINSSTLCHICSFLTQSRKESQC